ncbi:MAG TPA: cytochrome C biogenesis protein [Gammaproteobacteria bacterium]|nr:cytochrome C biogenesis protein [Gammaproteobacteria bacterium]
MFPEFDLDRQTLQATFHEASFAALGIAFLAGFVFSFNPVSFASIPVVLAYVTRAEGASADRKRQALSLGAAFVAGLIITHVLLGVIAAFGGEWVKSIMGREWGLFLGPLLIVLGLMWPGWLRLRLPWMAMRGRKVSGHWGAFLLAIPFSVAICPFCAPALLITLTASAAIGSVMFGAALLLAFASGRSIPIMLGAWSMGWLESLQVVGRHHRLFEIIGGITLIVTGLYMLNEYLFIIAY